MKIGNPEELNTHGELFIDPQRPLDEKQGPYLIVVDDFYDEPLQIRRMALAQKYYQYSPPLESQVGIELAKQFTSSHPQWLASSLLRYHGTEVNNPHPGFRYAPVELQKRLSQLIKEQTETKTWSSLGDGWNGAFHLQYEGAIPAQWAIHHHYKENDICRRDWSGLVYLNPVAPEISGTSNWRDKSSGKYIAQKGAIFSKNTAEFEKVLTIQNKFNRLVLLRENVLHRAEQAFGDSPASGRLTQTFFFHSNASPQ